MASPRTRNLRVETQLEDPFAEPAALSPLSPRYRTSSSGALSPRFRSSSSLGHAKRSSSPAQRFLRRDTVGASPGRSASPLSSPRARASTSFAMYGNTRPESRQQTSQATPSSRTKSARGSRPSKSMRAGRARHNSDWDFSRHVDPKTLSTRDPAPLPGRPATAAARVRTRSTAGGAQGGAARDRTTSMPPIGLSRSLPITKEDRNKVKATIRQIESTEDPNTSSSAGPVDGERHPSWSPLKHRTGRLNQVLYHFEDVLFKNKLIALENELAQLERREVELEHAELYAQECCDEKTKQEALEKELQKLKREQALIHADVEQQERKIERLENTPVDTVYVPPKPGRSRAYSVKRHVEAKLRKGQPRLILIKRYLREEMTPDAFREALGALDHTIVSAWTVDMCLQLKRLGKLLSLNDVITQSLESMERAMNRICLDACETLEAERATLWAIDAKKRELYSYTSNGLQIRIPEDAGIAGACFQGGDIENIPDAYEDDRFNSEVDKNLGLRTKAILACPVQAHAGYRIGCIQVMNKKDGGVFDDGDTRALEGIAIRAGIYLLQAQTYEEVVAIQRQTPILQEVMSSFINEMKLQTALEHMVQEVVSSLQAERATIWLADFRHEELHSTPAYGETEEIRTGWHEGIAGRCFSSKEIVHVKDAYSDPDFNTAVDIKTGFTTRSILCVPIYNRYGNAMGVIQAMNKKADNKTGEDRDFSEQDRFLLKSVAVQAGFNLEYARLYQEAWQHMSAVVTADKDFPE